MTTISGYSISNPAIRFRRLANPALAVVTFALCGSALRADEGLWLFNQFPHGRVLKSYGVSVTETFLRNIRQSSVRLNNGGSGSFVSSNGLVFTNHHVASECVQKLSTAAHDYMKNGFHAASHDGEKACPDVEINVLLRIEDVTGKVRSATTSGVAPAEANRLRKAAMTRIEKECTDATRNRCDVVTLYSGGQYHLYQYKKYTDVRLVFAPEADIAAFGGDPDNFTYPRYCLDFAFLRVYEHGKPAATPHFLPWSLQGVQNGELTFVPGHPGSTGRLATMTELEFSRDVSYPLVLARVASLIGTLESYSRQSEEAKRIAADNLFSQQNSAKAYTGFLRGLRDAKLMDRKRSEEKRLRGAVADDPKKQAEFGRIWDEVESAYAELRQFYKPYYLLERTAGRGSDLMTIATHVLRYAEEKTKPNDQRLREYVDTALPSLEQSMFSPAPIFEKMEIAVVADYLRFLRDQLGADDPTVKQLLNGRTPEKAAEEYVTTSKLADVAERKRLAGDREALKQSNDGMIRLARILDGPARKLRKRYEDRVEAILLGSASRIAQARFAVYGPGDYPDATFTLRLSYGPVKGYRNARGETVPYATDFAGLYRRATGKEPFRLPESWLRARNSLNLKTPFNFVTTNDTHGGNSGSPTINAKGEVVGILFDGNMEGLPNRFVFTDEMARSVHVASQGIVEALRTVYKAQGLLRELGL